MMVKLMAFSLSRKQGNDDGAGDGRWE